MNIKLRFNRDFLYTQLAFIIKVITIPEFSFRYCYFYLSRLKHIPETEHV